MITFDGGRLPLLSVIVVVFDMQREAPRTLYTLSRHYQRDIEDVEYEVLVVENGSSHPLDPATIAGMGPEFRYLPFPTTSVSPAGAINHGAAHARGEHVMVCIDGARMLSPRVLYYSLLALRCTPEPVVATLSWHLGPDIQARSMSAGYCQAVEDDLLGSVDWRIDGYRLFEVSSLAASSRGGWFAPLPESNCVTVRRSLFDAIGGYDVSFASPGGGLANHDYLDRACAEPGSQLVVLLGEGTFHQFHNGVATNAPPGASPWRAFAEEYATIRRRPYSPRSRPHLVLGHMPSAATRFLDASARQFAPSRDPVPSSGSA